MSSEIPPPPPSSDKRGSGRFGSDQGWPKWMIWVLLGVVVAAVLIPTLAASSSGTKIAFGDFKSKLTSEQVKSATYNNTNGNINGEPLSTVWFAMGAIPGVNPCGIAIPACHANDSARNAEAEFCDNIVITYKVTHRLDF